MPRAETKEARKARRAQTLAYRQATANILAQQELPTEEEEAEYQAWVKQRAEERKREAEAPEKPEMTEEEFDRLEKAGMLLPPAPAALPFDPEEFAVPKGKPYSEGVAFPKATPKPFPIRKKEVIGSYPPEGYDFSDPFYEFIEMDDGNYINGEGLVISHDGEYVATSDGVKTYHEIPTLKEISDFDEIIVDGKAYGLNRFGDVIDEDGNYKGRSGDKKSIKSSKAPWYWDAWRRDKEPAKMLGKILDKILESKPDEDLKLPPMSNAPLQSD